MNASAVDGDGDGFDAYARDQAAWLGRVAYLLTGDREAARDLAQDTLVDAFRQWDRVRGAVHQRAYVRRMMLNRHLSSRRRRRVREIATEPPDRSGDGPSLSDGHAEHDVMWRALATLSDRQRAVLVLVLRHYEGLDDEAIAAALRCGRSTVRSLATRAVAALRDNPHLRDSAGGKTRSTQ